MYVNTDNRKSLTLYRFQRFLLAPFDPELLNHKWRLAEMNNLLLYTMSSVVVLRAVITHNTRVVDIHL